jgi:hypothetical protein
MMPRRPTHLSTGPGRKAAQAGAFKRSAGTILSAIRKEQDNDQKSCKENYLDGLLLCQARLGLLAE